MSHRRSGNWYTRFALCLGVVVCTVGVFGVVPAAGAEPLFHDAFDAKRRDVNRRLWTTVEGDAAYFGRTAIMNPRSTADRRGRIRVSGGAANLRLCLFNPTAIQAGDSFWGSEMDSISRFALPANGDGIAFTARVELPVNAPRGIVMSLFAYALTEPGASARRDEIDIEILTNHYPTQGSVAQVLLNRFANEPGGAGRPILVPVPSLVPGEINELSFHWYADTIHWFVNGQLLHTATDHIPAGPMGVRLNIWAPGSDFASAYDANLQPVTQQRDDECFIYRVHDVQVKGISRATLLTSEPPDQAIGLPDATRVVLRFKDSMDRDACGEAIRFEDDRGNVVPIDPPIWGTTARPDDTVELVPSERLDPAMGYRVSLTPGCRSLAGRSVDSTQVRFSTGGGPSSALPPAVVATLPGERTTLHIDQPFLVTEFDRPLDPRTVTPETVGLSGPGRPKFEIQMDPSRRAVTLIPNNRWRPGRYTVVLGPQLAGADGMPLGRTWKWQGRAPNLRRSRPEIRLVLPPPPDSSDTGLLAHGTRYPIVLAFDEGIDPRSLGNGALMLRDETADQALALVIEDWQWRPGGATTLVVRPALGHQWHEGHEYRLTVGRSLRDYAFNGLRRPFSRAFLGADAATVAPEVSYWKAQATRHHDGRVALHLGVRAQRAYDPPAGASPLEVTAAAPSMAPRSWSLAADGTGEFRYLTSAGADEALPAGEHAIDFAIRDGFNAEQAVIPATVVVLPSAPQAVYPGPGAADVSVQPDLHFRLPAELDADLIAPVHVVTIVDDHSDKVVFRQRIGHRPKSEAYQVTVPPVRALTPSHPYRWWVESFDGEPTVEASARSADRRFTTAQASAPLRVRLIAPASQSTAFGALEPRAVVAPGVDPIADVAFELDNGQVRRCVDAGARAEDEAYSCSVPIQELDHAKTYRLSAIATDVSGRQVRSAPIALTVANPDLALTLRSAKLPDGRCSGDGSKYQLSLSVGNAGAARVARGVRAAMRATLLADADDSAQHGIDAPAVKVSRLAPGARVGAKLKLTLPPGIPAGSYRWAVSVDPDGALGESDESNNAVETESFTVCEGTRDLEGSVQSAKLPSAIVAGNTTKGQIELDVFNRGNVALAPGQRTDIGLYLVPETSGPDLPLTSVERRKLGALAPGKRKRHTVRFEIPDDAPLGCFHVVAVLDEQAAVAEFDEGNNRVIGPRLCIAPPFVNLTGTVAANAKLPGLRSAGDGAAFKLPIDLRNQGNVAIPKGTRVEVLTRAIGAASAANVVAPATADAVDPTHTRTTTVKIGGLGPGQIKRVNVPAVIAPGLEGDALVEVDIDAGDVLGESDEGDNRVTSGPIRVSSTFVKLMRLNRHGESGKFVDPRFPRDVTTLTMSDAGAPCHKLTLGFGNGSGVGAEDDFTFCVRANGVEIVSRGGQSFEGEGSYETPGLFVEQGPMQLGVEQVDTAPVTGQFRLRGLCTMSIPSGTATARLKLLGYEPMNVRGHGRREVAKFYLKIRYAQMSGMCGGAFIDELDHREEFTFWAHPDIGVVKAKVTVRAKICARAAGAGCVAESLAGQGVRVP